MKFEKVRNDKVLMHFFVECLSRIIQNNYFRTIQSIFDKQKEENKNSKQLNFDLLENDKRSEISEAAISILSELLLS